MGTLIMIGQFILSLSILIVLHECGHFFPAKWFNTKVEKFYLFFDPWFSLWKTKKGETEYGIGWLPLGGYVKIAGMIDESFDKEQMQGEPQPWEFRSKPAWQRLIIMLGGVTVNFVLGVLLFAIILFKWGEEFLPNSAVENGIAVSEIGKELGLRDGDKVLKIGDKDFDRFSSGKFSSEIIINNAASAVVERDGKEVTIPIDPKYVGILSSQKHQKTPLFSLRFPMKVAKLAPESPAKASEAGLRVEDQIIAVNGTSIQYYHQFIQQYETIEGDQLSLDVLRGRDTVNVSYGSLFPEKKGLIKRIFKPNEEPTKRRRIGFEMHGPSEYFDYETQKFTLAEAIPGGFNKGGDFLMSQIKAFRQMFANKIKASESLGSFISIGKLFGTAWEWERFWNLTAMLSILLGFINLLPIPALDGGHVMFLLYEVITGIKPSDRVIEIATMGGFIILVMLMIFAIGLDISRLF